MNAPRDKCASGCAPLPVAARWEYPVGFPEVVKLVEVLQDLLLGCISRKPLDKDRVVRRRDDTVRRGGIGDSSETVVAKSSTRSLGVYLGRHRSNCEFHGASVGSVVVHSSTPRADSLRP